MRELDCLEANEASALPIWPIGQADAEAFLAGRSAAEAAFLTTAGFRFKSGEIGLLPGQDGLAGAVLGLGEMPTLYAFGDLARRLPPVAWRFEPGHYDQAMAQLGFCLGAYRFPGFKQTAAKPLARLACAEPDPAARRAAESAWMARDLINLPPNDLGPADLAAAVSRLGESFGASVATVTGDDLARDYPTVTAVGIGSDRPPAVAKFDWRGSTAPEDAPLVALCGKGVCFDTGGYDIKPPAGMLRMKKDMGGAAVVLGVARMIMAADLPIRLAVRIGCVENSVSGHAMRPLDVLLTRSGKSVEVGNTDAEGRLVLCDLLDEVCQLDPALVVDCATLTGAARTALGPDLPAMFCNDDQWADDFHAAGAANADPVWRLPLWAGYESWIDSPVADMNNVSAKPMAGAIVAALFLQRFVNPSVKWAHFDIYCWNDSRRPGRPEGGECQAMRTIHDAIAVRFDAK